MVGVPGSSVPGDRPAKMPLDTFRYDQRTKGHVRSPGLNTTGAGDAARLWLVDGGNL